MSVDQTLIDDCIKGKSDAINKLYHNYTGLMFGICYRYSGSRADAEDIMQEGFVKIFRNIKKFQNKGSFEGWMKKIMVNSALTFLKNKKKNNFIENVEILPDKNSDIYDNQEFDYNITPEELMNYITKLPDNYRLLINMFAIEKYSHKEIAEILGISENVSRIQFYRAKKILLEMFKKHIVVKELEYLK